MNKLIIIGWTGVKRAYLNVDREEAIRRYMLEERTEDRPDDQQIHEINFTDEFGVYDAWEIH